MSRDIPKSVVRRFQYPQTEGPRAARFYDPLLSPHFLRNNSPEAEHCQNMPCHRVLFESAEDFIDFNDKTLELDEEPPLHVEKPDLNCPLFKMTAIHTQTSIHKQFEDNKENSSSNNSSRIYEADYGAIRRRAEKYPETPHFKRILKSTFPEFLNQFAQKIKKLEEAKDPCLKIPNVAMVDPPVKHVSYPYKFYLGLAETIKKSLGFTEERALTKIATYLQPMDELCWESLGKIELQFNQFQSAVKLLKTGVICTKSENLLDKYMKYAERGNISQYDLESLAAHLFEVSAGKIERFYKLLIEVSSILFQRSNEKASAQIIFYLLKWEVCSLCILDLVDIMEAQKDHYLALARLKELVEGKVVRHPVIFQVYIKLLEQISDYQGILNGLELIQARIETSCPKDSKWKIHFEVAQVYLSLERYQKYREQMTLALMLSKEPLRTKVYFSIASVMRCPIPIIKNSNVTVEINRRRFIEAVDAEPIFYNFVEWKYYLHYSLFYLINKNEDALAIFSTYTQKKGNSGRLHAELIWIDRAMLKQKEAFDRWKDLVMEMPKSGEIWCEGGRIFVNQGEIERACSCFKIAIELTPQFGDSFIQLLNIYLIQGRYQDIKQLKKKVIYADPNYGSLWSYLKRTSKSSVMDIWRRAKYTLRCQLYSWNSQLMEVLMGKQHLTAVSQFNQLFFKQRSLVSKRERENLFFSYDQIEAKG